MLAILVLAAAWLGEPFEESWEPGPLQIRLWLSDRTPPVSDAVAVRLTVTAAVDLDVELPDPRRIFSSRGDPAPQVLDVRSLGTTVAAGGDRVWELRFRIDATLPGVVELPALVVRYRRRGESSWSSAATGPVSLEFRSMLGGKPDAAEPKSNPGPLAWPDEPRGGGSLAAPAAGMALGAAAAALAWVRWVRQRRRPPPLPPGDKALRALDAMHRAGWLESMEMEPFYRELSAVVRRYIEERHGVRAPEQTTQEFFAELGRRPIFDPDARGFLSEFLEQCDQVKFARLTPAVADARAALQAARRFIEATAAAPGSAAERRTETQHPPADTART